MADASSEFGLLLRTRIAQHRIYLGAEVDCYDAQLATKGSRGAASGSGSGGGSGGQAQQAGQQAQQVQQVGPQAPQQQQQLPLPPLGALLELKTYRLPSRPQQQRSIHRYRHPKWWLQSFLAGVPRLALGARDDQVGVPML